jgi:hypothetical protein
MPNTKATGVAFVDPQLESATFTPTTVALLPTASASIAGMRMVVSNSNAAYTAGIGATVAAGGAFVVPVFCNGVNWLIG